MTSLTLNFLETRPNNKLFNIKVDPKMIIKIKLPVDKSNDSVIIPHIKIRISLTSKKLFRISLNIVVHKM